MTVQRRISSYDWVPANDLIKVVAMVLMVIDHVAWAFSRHPALGRALGRGAFPLFAALLVIGMRRTRDPGHYLGRLTLFAVVSQYPFALCFEGLNIGFTLATGGLALYAGENVLEWNRQTGHPWRGWLGWAAAMGAAGIVASLLNMDYGGMGILAMAILQRSPTASVGIPLMMGWTVLFGWLHHWWAASWGAPVVGAVLLLGWWLRGWKQRFLPRWIVYAFYPVHLAIIGFILTAWVPGGQSKEPAPEPAATVVREHPRTDAPGREVRARGGRNSLAISPTQNLEDDLIRATVPNQKWAGMKILFIPVSTSTYGDFRGWRNPFFSSDSCNIAGIRGRHTDGRSSKYGVRCLKQETKVDPASETKPIVPGCPETGADREDRGRSLPPEGSIVRNKANFPARAGKGAAGQATGATGSKRAKQSQFRQHGFGRQVLNGKRVRTNLACNRHWQNKANFPDSGRRRKSGGTPNLFGYRSGQALRRADRGHPAMPVVQTKPICPAKGHKSRRRAVLPAKQSQFRADRKGQERARLWRRQPGQLCETKPICPHRSPESDGRRGRGETKPISAAAGRTYRCGVCHRVPTHRLGRRNDQVEPPEPGGSM